jgi:putative lipoprotein
MRIVALLVALVAILAGCAPEAPASPTRVSRPDTLAGTVWRLVAIGDRPVPAGPDVTLRFGPSEVSGNGSCNAFGGSYAYDATSGAIRIADLVSTKRACIEPGRNELEATYLATLRAASDASIDPDGRLVLTGAGVLLVLEVAGVPTDLPLEAPSAAP